MAQNRYITVEELSEAYDQRTLGQLSSDSGNPAIVDEGNVIILAAIERGSAMVEAAALMGGRYSVQDLLDRQLDDDFVLKNLVCRLTIIELHRRRIGAPVSQDILELIRETSELLRQIREGETVFRDDAAISAGNIEIEVIPAMTRAYLNFASDLPFYPPRRNRVF